MQASIFGIGTSFSHSSIKGVFRAIYSVFRFSTDNPHSDAFPFSNRPKMAFPDVQPIPCNLFSSVLYFFAKESRDPEDKMADQQNMECAVARITRMEEYMDALINALRLGLALERALPIWVQ